MGLYLSRVAADSRIYKLTISLRKKARTILRNSFLGKITDSDKNLNLINILNNSKLILFLENRYKKCGFITVNYLKGSEAVNLIRVFKGRLRSQPFKAGSIFVIAVILTNISLYALSGIKISYWGWFIRGIFLFVAISGLRSDISYEKLCKTSYFLRHLNNPCKI